MGQPRQILQQRGANPRVNSRAASDPLPRREAGLANGYRAGRHHFRRSCPHASSPLQEDAYAKRNLCLPAALPDRPPREGSEGGSQAEERRLAD